MKQVRKEWRTAAEGMNLVVRERMQCPQLLSGKPKPVVLTEPGGLVLFQSKIPTFTTKSEDRIQMELAVFRRLTITLLNQLVPGHEPAAAAQHLTCSRPEGLPRTRRSWRRCPRRPACSSREARTTSRERSTPPTRRASQAPAPDRWRPPSKDSPTKAAPPVAASLLHRRRRVAACCL